MEAQKHLGIIFQIIFCSVCSFKATYITNSLINKCYYENHLHPHLESWKSHSLAATKVPPGSGFYWLSEKVEHIETEWGIL